MRSKWVAPVVWSLVLTGLVLGLAACGSPDPVRVFVTPTPMVEPSLAPTAAPTTADITLETPATRQGQLMTGTDHSMTATGAMNQPIERREAIHSAVAPSAAAKARKSRGAASLRGLLRLPVTKKTEMPIAAIATAMYNSPSMSL